MAAKIPGIDDAVAPSLLRAATRFGVGALRRLGDALPRKCEAGLVWEPASRAWALLEFVDADDAARIAGARTAVDAAGNNTHLLTTLLGHFRTTPEFIRAVKPIAGLDNSSSLLLQALKACGGKPEDFRSLVTALSEVPVEAAGPVLSLVAMLRFERSTLAWLQSLQPSTAADTARWVAKVAGGDVSKAKYVIRSISESPEHPAQRRQVIEAFAADEATCAPVLQVLEATAFEPKGLALFTGLGAAAAVETAGWVTETAKRDVARTSGIVALLSKHSARLDVVRREVEVAGGDPGLAAPKLDQLAAFRYDDKLLATAGGLADTAAKQQLDETMKQHEGLKPTVSKQKWKQGVRPPDVEHIRSGSEEYAKLEKAATQKKQNAASADAKNALKYIGEREKAEAQMASNAAQHVAELGKVASAARGVETGMVDWVFRATNGDAALSRALTDLIAAAGPDGERLAKEVVALEAPLRLDAAGTSTQLLRSGAKPDDALRAAGLLAKHPGPDVRSLIIGSADGDLGGVVAFLTRHQDTIGVAAILASEMGMKSDADDLVPVLAKQKAVEVRWFTGLVGTAGYDSFAKVVRNKGPFDLAKLHELVSAGATKGFGLALLADWIGRASVTVGAVADAIEGADPNCPTYVDLVLQLGAQGKHLIDAIRAEAQLRDVGNTGVMVVVNTGHYKGGARPEFAKGRKGSRTGFVTLSFPGRPPGELHTHWYTSEMKLTSVHVKAAGKNGIELNQWKGHFHSVLAQACTIHGLSGLELQTMGDE